LTNPSYIYAYEAKYYYEIGDFKKAYELAHKAYLMYPYNNMAFTIEVQSKIAMRWKQFIDDVNLYLKKIEKIANKKVITNKDRLRVKIMLEILLSEYKTLKKSRLLPKKLVEEANRKYKEVKELYEEIFGKRSG